jgi:hypothetical protein
LLENFGSSSQIEKRAWEDINREALMFNKKLSDEYGERFIDTYKLLCEQEKKSCKVYTNNFYPMMFDGIHFTPEAVEEIADKKVKEVFGFLFQ